MNCPTCGSIPETVLVSTPLYNIWGCPNKHVWKQYKFRKDLIDEPFASVVE